MKRYLIKIFGKEAYLTTNNCSLLTAAHFSNQPFPIILTMDPMEAFLFNSKSDAIETIERLPKNYYTIETVYQN